MSEISEPGKAGVGYGRLPQVEGFERREPLEDGKVVVPESRPAELEGR